MTKPFGPEHRQPHTLGTVRSSPGFPDIASLICSPGVVPAEAAPPPCAVSLRPGGGLNLMADCASGNLMYC